jgi:hypothetical protein
VAVKVFGQMSGSVPSSFGVSGTSGPLGSFLSESLGTNNIFSAFSSATSSGAAATATALGSGGLTTKQHNVIQTLGDSGTPTVKIPWNTNGTEPTLLTQLRTYGWIKATRRDNSGGTSGAYYKLTPIGQAIYKRTGGGKAGATLSASDLNNATSGTGLSKSQVSELNSLLSALGSTGTGSSATSLGNSTTTTTPGVSTGSTGSLVNVLT